MLDAFFAFGGRPLLTSTTHFGGGGTLPLVFWSDMLGNSDVTGSVVALADSSKSDKLE